MKNVVPAHRRHDISDETWALLEPHLLGREGAWGVSPRTIDCLSMRCSGFCERARHGGICRPITADGANMHRRFIRWRDKGVLEKLLNLLINEPDDEWLMIDTSHCKAHPYAAGVKGGHQDMSRTQGGSIPRYIWPWMRRVCRSESF